MAEEDFQWSPPVPPVVGQDQPANVSTRTDNVEVNPDDQSKLESTSELQGEDARARTEETQDKGEELRKKREEERNEVHSKMEAILAEYNNKESDIPLTHDYWGLRNRFLALR